MVAATLLLRLMSDVPFTAPLFQRPMLLMLARGGVRSMLSSLVLMGTPRTRLTEWFSVNGGG
jgi:hypothetical protein